MLRHIFGRSDASRSASPGNVESRQRDESPPSSSSKYMRPFNSPKASNQRRGAVRPAEMLSSEPSKLELRRPLSAGDVHLVFEEQRSERLPSAQDEDRGELEETNGEKREEKDRQTKERKNERTNIGLLSRINLHFLNLSAITKIIEFQVLNDRHLQSCENHGPPREQEETDKRSQKRGEPDASEPRAAGERHEGPRHAHMTAANVYRCYCRADNRIYPI